MLNLKKYLCYNDIQELILMKDMIKVGTITSTHGIRGEVKIIGDNDCFSPSFKEALFIETNPMTEVHIKTVKNQIYQQ